MKVRVVVPKKIDASIRAMAEALGLDIDQAQFLKQRREKKFEPEQDNCHVNNLVKQKLDGGELVYGWVIGQDKLNDVIEAHFYSVWKDSTGNLADISPRPTNEKRLLFVPDSKRSIGYTGYEGRPALIVFDTVRMHKNELITGVREKIFVPYSKLIYEYGFARKSEIA